MGVTSIDRPVGGLGGVRLRAAKGDGKLHRGAGALCEEMGIGHRVDIDALSSRPHGRGDCRAQCGRIDPMPAV